MKEFPNTVGGWGWWCEQWKAAHQGVPPNYKTMMQSYIKGESPSA